MNEDLEQRLQRLSVSAVAPFDDERVDELERQLLTEPHRARRTPWITVAAAVCLVLGVVVALTIRRDDPNSVQPSASTHTDPSTTSTTTTTTMPGSIPAASFRLAVERVGSELHFSWAPYTGTDATRYVLISVGADGLTSWPVPESDIVVTTRNIATDSATVALRAQPRRRWVLAVIDDNRRLIAVSNVAVSD